MTLQRYCTNILIPLLRAKGSSVFAMFKAYLDESGMDKNTAVVIGGIAGRKEACDWAAERWNEVLRNARINGPFHSIEFWNRTNGRMHEPYEHLSISDADLLVGLLADIVTDPTLIPIAITISIDEFMTLTEDERRWLTTNKRFGRDWVNQGSPTNPYFFAFQSCTQVAAMVTPPEEKVYFTFDRQDAFANRARRLFNEILSINNETTRKMGAELAFSSKEGAVMLQAADLIAYLSRWYAEDEKSMVPAARECFKRMAEPQESKICFITRPNMDTILKRCPFRTTFWPGLTKPDFVEQMRMNGYNVVAYKAGEEYRSDYIRPNKVRTIGKLHRSEGPDGIVRFSVVKAQDKDQSK